MCTLYARRGFPEERGELGTCTDRGRGVLDGSGGSLHGHARHGGRHHVHGADPHGQSGRHLRDRGHGHQADKRRRGQPISVACACKQQLPSKYKTFVKHLYNVGPR